MKDMIDKNKRVYVYFNLHRKCFSVRQSNKVVQHANRVCLRDVRYLVGDAGRKQVLKTGTKNVHAGVSGYYVDYVPVPWISFNVTYNPFIYDSFVDCLDHEPVDHSDYAYLECGKDWKTIEAIFEKAQVED
jgi:hypothetical protein